MLSKWVATQNTSQKIICSLDTHSGVSPWAFMERSEQPRSNTIEQMWVDPEKAAQCNAVFCSTSHSCGFPPRSSKNLKGVLHEWLLYINLFIFFYFHLWEGMYRIQTWQIIDNICIVKSPLHTMYTLKVFSFLEKGLAKTTSHVCSIFGYH